MTVPPRRVSTDRLNNEDSQLAASLEGEPGGPTPAGKTLPHSYPNTRFRGERAQVDVLICLLYRRMVKYFKTYSNGVALEVVARQINEGAMWPL